MEAEAVVYKCPTECKTRTFSWCEQKWLVKHSPTEKVGPGPSTFDLRNVELGEDGSLRLWVRDVTGNSGVVSSAEVQTIFPLGYGQYQVDVHGPLTGERWNYLVFGFFTYDFDDSTEGNREIDIEIGTFDGRHFTGGVFSNYNDTRGGQQLMNIDPARNSLEHRLFIEWTPCSIIWTLVDRETGFVLNELTSRTAVPSCDGACFVMNLWQFKDIAPNERGQYITLRDFKHIPLQNSQQKELNFIHSLAFEDNRNKFVKGVEYKNIQILLKATRRMTNVRLWIDQSRKIVKVDYPKGRDYAMLHNGVDIKGGQTDFVTCTLTFLDEHETVVPIAIFCDQFKSPFIYSLPVQIVR